MSKSISIKSKSRLHTGSGYFRKVDGICISIDKSGKFRQLDIYARDKSLYVSADKSFVRLMANGGTSSTGVHCDELIIHEQGVKITQEPIEGVLLS